MKHKHHIVPRHVGGSDNADNIVELSIEEHAEEHRKLFEEFGRWQDECAYKLLSKLITIEEARQEAARRGKEEMMKNHLESKQRDKPVSKVFLNGMLKVWFLGIEVFCLEITKTILA
jgi:hypothetical protein